MACAAAFLAAVSTAQDAEWEGRVQMDGQLFPSFIIATQSVQIGEDEADPSVLGDQAGLIGALVANPAAGTKAKLVVSAPGYIDESTFETTMPEAGEEYALMPTLNWDFEKLHAQEQGMPITVNYTLTLNGKPAGTRTAKAFVRSVNDCPFFWNDEESGEGLDLSWMFAAYVNEDHPWIDEVLSEALQTGVVNSFNGYQSGDPDQVLLQVFAIWKTLRNQGIKYSNITQAVGRNNAVFSQEVRFLDQCINNAQANCVDGSVLLASFLRKIDIHAVLVMVPGHCYLAFALDDEGTVLTGLETTMMGGNAPDYESIKDELPPELELSEEMIADEDFMNFLAAVGVGTSALAEHAAEFGDPNNPGYELIEVEAARTLGIMPIAR